MFGADAAAAVGGRRRSTRAAPTPSPRSPRYWIGGQLPRGLRPVRLQRDPLQPRVPAPRRDLRHPQDHPRGRPHQGRPAGQALPRQPRRAPRLGLRARLRRGDVADAPGRRARRLRDRHRRDAHGPRVLRARLRARRPRPRRTTSRSTRATTARPRSTRSSGDPSKAREELGWEPKVRFDELVEMMVDADIAALEAAARGQGHPLQPRGDRMSGSPDRPSRPDSGTARRSPSPAAPGSSASP